MKKMLAMISLLAASVSFATTEDELIRTIKLKSEDSEKIIYTLKDCFGKQCVNRGKLIFSKTQTNDAAVATQFCEANKAESFDEAEIPFILISVLVEPSKDSLEFAKKLERKERKYVYWNAGESVNLLFLSDEEGIDLNSFTAEQAKEQNIQANVLCKTEK